QLEAADLVLISRADCLSASEIDLVHKGLAPQLQPGAVLLSMGRGVVSPELVLGLERRQPTIPGHDHDDHDHDHHDHSHVAIESLALELHGDFCRVALEQQLLQLVSDSALIRLKGRLWLSGKNRPLQIQAVGPRLECWFEPGAGQTSAAQQAPGLELVLLGFQLDQPGIESCLNQALSAELAVAN
ncbi:MAG: GTP-binding protein, partial [Cyanobium sp. MAG_137]|nr:GTP-binding protein [Cyanobium sp. MAG_137]